jgi:Ca-activated chloride channel homolog
MNNGLRLWWRTGAALFLVLASMIAAPQLLRAQPSSGTAAFVPTSLASGGESHITIRTELVSFNVTVTDKEGRYVAGLDHTAFAVYEDGVQQEISFFSDRDAPASIGVVFDVSGSMTGEKIRRAKNALVRFLQTSHPEDEYSLVSFNDFAELQLDRTRDSEMLLAQFGGIRPQGNTALYDAVALAVETVARSQYAKRALLVISDGEDNRSRSTFGQLRKKFQEAGVTVYTILIGPLLPRSNGGAVMKQLASASGGKSFFPSNEEAMSGAFEQIALELRHQYSVGYASTNLMSDGRWRRVKVKVTPPDDLPRLIVRSREGYFALTNR